MQRWSSSQVPRCLLKQVVEFENLAMHHIVHYTVLFRNQGVITTTIYYKHWVDLPGRGEQACM